MPWCGDITPVCSKPAAPPPTPINYHPYWKKPVVALVPRLGAAGDMSSPSVRQQITTRTKSGLGTTVSRAGSPHRHHGVQG